ncbi:MAG TPA: transcription antiterminator [Bacillota bacterium]|nr:transcription antiterminator [Bacillota bacterium]
MRKREKEILNLLLNSANLVTGTEIAEVTGVTSRTIRNDIQMLRAAIIEHGADIYSHSGLGYKIMVLDPKAFIEFVDKLRIQEVSQYEVVPSDSDERVLYLIKKLLIVDFHIKIEDLADELFVSRTTIAGDLRKVRRQIKQYHLSIEQRSSQGIRIVGSEMMKRLCISEYLFHQSSAEGHFVEDSVLFTSSVNKAEITVIKSTVTNEIQNYGLKFSDISVQNLVVHIIISLRRMRFSNYVEFDEPSVKMIRSKCEYQAALDISQALSRQFNEIWPEEEVCYLAIQLLSKKMVDEDKNEPENGRAKTLVRKFLKDVFAKTAVNFMEDKQLVHILTLHVDLLLFRLEMGVIARNPLISEIKNLYAEAYSMAEIAAETITGFCGERPAEDEIGYLALYLGMSLEKKEFLRKKKKVLLVSIMGKSFSDMQKLRIINRFSEYIEFLDTAEVYEIPNIDTGKYDVILSPIDLEYDLGKPVILVSGLLQEHDFLNIFEAVSFHPEQK